MDMLNWICPDCGRECLPATRECPACAEDSAKQAIEGSSVTALSAAVSGGHPGFQAGSTGSVGVATAVLEPPTSEPEPRPALEQDLRQVGELLGERISQVQQQYAWTFLQAHFLQASYLQTQSKAQRHPEPQAEPLQSAMMNGLQFTQQRLAEAALRAEAEEQWDAQLAEAAAAQLTPVIDIWEAAQRVHAEEIWRARSEEAGRRQKDRRIKELEGSISGNTVEQVHDPLKQAVQNSQPRESAWDLEVARQREASAANVAEDAALAMRVYAREMLEMQAEAALRAAYRRAIDAVFDPFKLPPPFALLGTPQELLLVPVRIAGHRKMGLDHLQVCAPESKSKAAADCGFPSSTPLAIKAQSRLQAEKPELIVEPKRVFPTWMLSAVAVAATILVGANFFRTNNEPAEAKTPAETAISTENKPSPSVGQAAANTTTATTPFTKDVEVSGLRIGVDVLHRSQLQYVVVNHSGVQLSGLVLHIKVTSTAPANKGVLFQVSAVVPSLGPNESKEIRTDIEGQLQSKPIPDWQYLKTEVQVSTQ